MARLLRTNAFRLAALYFALFAASVLALLGFIYFSTADFIERQTEATIDAEITGLREQYQERGLPGLLEIIHARSTAAQHSNPRRLYLVTDPALHPLAGNLSAWPQARADPPRLDRLSGRSADAQAASPQNDNALRLGLRAARRLPPAGRPRSARRRGLPLRITRTLGWSALLTWRSASPAGCS